MKIFFQTAVIGILFSQSLTASCESSVTCKEVIAEQETQKGIPQDLLKAIAKVESGISPWVINSKGRAHVFRSKEAAVRHAKGLIDEGFTNFSVGCMQLHYASHRRNFKSVEAMFEPKNNITHAAKLIKKLERRHGSMERAVKLYHSASPVYHNSYKSRVYGTWAKMRRPKKDASLNTVALQKPQKSYLRTSKQASKIKFGLGAAIKKRRTKAYEEQHISSTAK